MTRRLCPWLLLGLALLCTALSYVLLVPGRTTPSSDGRQAVLLPPAERDLVLTEMRTFLASTQAITEALSRDDAQAAATAARAVGVAAQQAVPLSLMRKLPLGFKTLGRDTHEQFDQLALDAEQFGDPQQTLTALSELMQNCVACHAAYRLEAEVP